ncbi:hypothetical protein GCWU000342_00156 [Shuttleworthella satelles DSM 14600]|uniref:Uncharacterized protein n=1 Tax=Shuttleworthella satelles DSM 14600 TaxID=626523 RepID=C4G7Z0_9FIRM|nr:hypothetical protein GCWU000342_00156 [Shuttleworthia satelles DSM 14600]
MRDPTKICSACFSSTAFQSTGPVRDPTSISPTALSMISHFNPRVP